MDTSAIFIRALNVGAETGLAFSKIEFDCGCGTGPVIIWKKLLANTGLFVTAVYTVLSRARRFTDGPPPAPPAQAEPAKGSAPPVSQSTRDEFRQRSELFSAVGDRTSAQ